MDFGHVVWGGTLFGTPAAIIGSRGGEKELLLLRPLSTDPLEFDVHVLDAGGGPNQVCVVQEHDEGVLILSANHGAAEVALYELAE
jgi:hypothetical protein